MGRIILKARLTIKESKNTVVSFENIGFASERTMQQRRFGYTII